MGTDSHVHRHNGRFMHDCLVACFTFLQSRECMLDRMLGRRIGPMQEPQRHGKQHHRNKDKAAHPRQDGVTNSRFEDCIPACLVDGIANDATPQHAQHPKYERDAI